MYNQIDSNKRNTVFLMMIFLIVVMALGWVIGKAVGSNLIFPIAIIISIVQALVSYYYSDKIALGISRASEAPREEPYLELYRIVENLSITAGFQQPKIYIIEDSAPNAFATGRDPKHASIAVTSGLLAKLDKNELEGVIAHEMSHIGNYDIRIMTIVVVLVGVVALTSDLFLRWTWWGGGRRNNDNNNNGQLQLIFFIIAIVLAILAPIVAVLIQLAISRKREYLADASGALLTRYPEGLASALEKISNDTEPLEVANKATAHLYIANPIKPKPGMNSVGWFANLYNTHPLAPDRIKRLREMISK